MTYILVFIYSIAITSFGTKTWIKIQRDGICQYLVLSLVLIIPWLLICGGQYETGTDYNSYMETFTSGEVDLFYNKREFLFAKLVDLYHSTHLPPQGLYFVFYFIAFIFFFLTCQKINNRTLSIFIFLYFCVSNLFFNQLNGLRQSVATYIITYATLCLNQRRGMIVFIFWMAIGSLFHASSWFSLLILIFNKINLNERVTRLLLIITFIITICGGSIINYLFNSFNSIIPTIYTHYLESSFNQATGLIGMIPKIILFPLYYMSTQFLRMEKDTRLRKLYIIGILCYMFRLISIQNIILDRLGSIFVLISVLPLYLYWSQLLKNYQFKRLSFALFIPLILFLAKVIVLPEKEYLYNSVFYEAMKTL